DAAQPAGPAAPAPRYRPGAVLVAFEPGTAATQRRNARAAVHARDHHRVSPLAPDVELLTLPPGLPVDAAVQALRRNPNVRYAEPDYVRTVDAVPNDPGFVNDYLWGLYGPGGSPSSTYGINAATAWAAGLFGRQSVHVGIIDTGIEVGHPDLAPNIWTNPFETPGNGIDDDGNGYVDDIHGWDFFNDDASVFDSAEHDDHGTHVAGTIGGAGNNGTGVVGVNWSVTMISLKFIEGVGYDSDAVAAIDYLTDLKVRHGLNIPVSNNSWGGPDAGTAVRDAINRAADQGILFVAAAGNDHVNIDATPYYPAAWTCDTRADTGSPRGWDCIVSVAAITEAGARASFSNYGATAVDLGAPGDDIVSTYPGGTYASMSGTSMAAPHVTGTIALLAGCRVDPSPQAIRDMILATVAPTASMLGKTVTGGRLDASTFATLCDDPHPRAVVSTATGFVTTGTRAYTAWFSEPVTGFAAEDVVLGGTSAAWSVESVTGSGAGTYEITIAADGVPTDGTVEVAIAAGAVVGATDVGPTEPVRAPTLQVDVSVPSATVTEPASPTKATSLAFQVDVDQPVTGLAAGDFTTGGTATGCTVGTPSSSNGGRAWTVHVTGCSGGTLVLTLKPNSVLDGAGNAGPAFAVTAASVLIDRTAPTMSTGPTTSLRAGASASGSSIPIHIAWSGADAGGAGIARYELQRSNDGGSTWTVVHASITGTSWNTSTSTSGTRKFRVRAVDAAGNVGPWKYGPLLTPRLVQQTSSAIRYGGTWTGRSDKRFSGGSVRFHTVAGRSATYTFSGRAIAFITTLAPARGKVRIYLDGALQSTLDLTAATTTYQRLAWQKSFGSKGTHTLRIEVVGTAGRPRVDLDAFAVLQ
ncbi:MAG TPA: S8 family serine peptidase, partial [Candidatus Binatia bacterium]|nr:S8 family serine peptidase [Candidatus Binatia bacterium]